MKIKIAGAGLAGLTAAINLAKHDIEVEIHESGKTIGQRFSGDLQCINNWSSNVDSLINIKNWGIDDSFDYIESKENIQIWIQNKTFTLNPDKPVHYLVQRGNFDGSLDRAILEQAQQYPSIKIIFESTVQDFSTFDIIATGPVIRNPHISGMAAGYIFPTAMENQTIMALDDDLAPDGYSYLLVKHGTAVTTSCIFRDFKKLQQFRDSTFKFFQNSMDLKIQGKKKLFSGVGRFFLIKYNKEKLFVGEAGGFQDFMLGFGMQYAIQTGYLAAKSIIENINYYDLIRKHVHPSMKASVVNRLIYQIMNDKTYSWLVKTFASPNPEEKLKQLYIPKWWHRVIYPLASIYFRKSIQDPLRKQKA